MMHLPILLHWLAGYSTAQLMMLASGPIIFLSAAIMLFEALNDKVYLLWGSVAGLLAGSCWTAANLLRGRPRWEDLTDNLLIIGGASSITYAVLMVRLARRRNRPITVPPEVQPTMPSDKVWPPPPTAGD